jgi:acyl-CoA synthetase (AMP-forming)/AMP-acid ligase II
MIMTRLLLSWRDRDMQFLTCGAEPIRTEMLDEFFDYFASTGLRRQTMTPAYGLAEFTLCCTAQPVAEPPTLLRVDARQLHSKGVIKVLPKAESPTHRNKPLSLGLPVAVAPSSNFQRVSVNVALSLGVPEQDDQSDDSSDEVVGSVLGTGGGEGGAEGDGGVTYVSVGTVKSDTVVKIVDPQTLKCQVRELKPRPHLRVNRGLFTRACHSTRLRVADL